MSLGRIKGQIHRKLSKKNKTKKYQLLILGKTQLYRKKLNMAHYEWHSFVMITLKSFQGMTLKAQVTKEKRDKSSCSKIKTVYQGHNQ